MYINMELIFFIQVIKKYGEYVNQFAEFNNYVNSPIANYHGELYNMPFNMNTFYKTLGGCYS